MRYYYKSEKGLLNLKTPLADSTGYEEITEEEFTALSAQRRAVKSLRNAWAGNQPTLLERLEAQVTYTAMMTDTMMGGD